MNLCPELMMTAAERKQAKRCLRALQTFYVAIGIYDSLPPEPVNRAERLRAQKRKIDAELEALAATVLGREVGLEKFMVIDLKRSDTYQVKFQVLNFGLMGDFGTGDWGRQLSGRNVRKNGTLGKNREGAGFRTAAIKRRMLDGSWVTLGASNAT